MFKSPCRHEVGKNILCKYVSTLLRLCSFELRNQWSSLFSLIIALQDLDIETKFRNGLLVLVLFQSMYRESATTILMNQINNLLAHNGILESETSGN